ncbi:hypothetical protein Cgig2_022320 [Carnegiea gigantea]|uniref:Protein kinase domain-containing protein n=1 Tax=Carnegiea gigantea TaxID=171969 RepID=A0A9Q1Q7F6_9CARY|nr:hypothetical protein Cgig2_022320 [Carnegiea gigantea]
MSLHGGWKQQVDQCLFLSARHAGHMFIHILVSFSAQASLWDAEHAHSSGISSSLSAKLQMRKYRPSEGPAPAPAYLGPIVAPRHKSKLRHRYQHHHRHRHRHRLRPYAVSPNPDARPVGLRNFIWTSKTIDANLHGDSIALISQESCWWPLTTETGCDQICSDPLTPTPVGTPCGCVIPMKVRLRLSKPIYALFPVVPELEIEIASGTYLKQNQVQIVGATDAGNQDRTFVDINLLPLGERFDNTTAMLTYERLSRKEVPLNRSLFGNYDLIDFNYPGISSTYPPATGPALPTSANLVNKNRKMNSIVVFVVVFSALVILVACLVTISVLMKWRKLQKPSRAVRPVFMPSTNKKTGVGSTLSSSLASSLSMSLFASVPASALSVKTFSLSELEKATDKFNSRRILGEGGFGRVYHGILEDGIEMAVKLLTRENQNGDREFIAEVEMLSRLHHRNLVKLIGICIEGHRHCLVYELVHNGSVESHLHDVFLLVMCGAMDPSPLFQEKRERGGRRCGVTGAHRSKGPLHWDARMKIALGAARGLAYLHEDSNPRVIHRDFKASNVLLEDDYTPKVSDFGLAREAAEASQHVSTRVMGTFGYVAPEYAMTGHLLVKSDVYSYGVVLLELLTGRKPVDMSQPQGQENLVTWARPLLTSKEGVEQLVDPTFAGNYHFDDVAKVAAIASMCVHPEVTHRPFMGEVVQALKLIYNDSNETCEDCGSLKDSSVPDLDSKSDLGPSESCWRNAGNAAPRLIYGQDSSFITMDYSSGPIDEMGNRPFSTSSLMGERIAWPIAHENRSGSLRTMRSKPALYRLKGSMSEHAAFLSRRGQSDGFLF